MATNSDLLKQSYKTNFQNFVDRLTDQEVADLYRYLYITYSDTPANEIQKEFVDEFIGLDNFVEFVSFERKVATATEFGQPQPLWKPARAMESIQDARFFLAQTCSLRFLAVLRTNQKVVQTAKREDNFKAKLKKQLDGAIANSYEDEVFSKVEGFSNIFEVLVNNKLAEYPENEDD